MNMTKMALAVALTVSYNAFGGNDIVKFKLNDMSLSMPGVGTMFHCRAFAKNWRGSCAHTTLKAGETVGETVPCRIALGGGSIGPYLNGCGKVEAAKDGQSVIAHWELTPEEAIDIQMIYISAGFPVKDYLNGTVVMDGEEEKLEEFGDPELASNTGVKKLVLKDDNGKTRLTLDFEVPMELSFEKKNNDISMRAYLKQKKFPAGEKINLGFIAGTGRTIEVIKEAVK